MKLKRIGNIMDTNVFEGTNGVKYIWDDSNYRVLPDVFEHLIERPDVHKTLREVLDNVSYGDDHIVRIDSIDGDIIAFIVMDGRGISAYSTFNEDLLNTAVIRTYIDCDGVFTILLDA